ncbi:MAG TPA: hypothetical protein VG984_02475 [Candidatus Paceibacterota bacterium]|nr:hypothetical protein [Candidatus Paceibacterota bacterium]
MTVPEGVRDYFVPSRENSYRPRLLRRSSILFFVALIVVSEASFVTSLFVPQSNTIGSIQPSTQVAAVGTAGMASHFNSYMQSFGRQLIRMAQEMRPFVPWLLGLIAMLVVVALFLTFFVHIQIQQPEMLFSGMLVALFAVSLLVTDVHIVSLL